MNYTELHVEMSNSALHKLANHAIRSCAGKLMRVWMSTGLDDKLRTLTYKASLPDVTHTLEIYL